MKKRRVIPVILFRKGYTVQGKQFARYKNMGHLGDTLSRYSQWGADEVIVLDISDSEMGSNNTRSDLIHQGSASADFLPLLSNYSKKAFMPLAVGGGISSLKDIELRLMAGADKVVVNSAVVADPQFVRKAAMEFGSQCIVVHVNFKNSMHTYQRYISKFGIFEDFDLIKNLDELESSGAGEIILTDVTRDGMKSGYNLDALEMATSKMSIPIIASGGAGSWNDFFEAFSQTKVDAVAAANIFFHSDQSVFQAHDYLLKRGIHVRQPEFIERGW
jgi:cyclase